METSSNSTILSEKKHEDIQAMFDNIAPHYDFLNHFLSFNIDKYWRNKMISLLQNDSPRTILDLACGTCDLSIALAKHNPQKIVACDLSPAMLEIGKQKIEKKQLSNIISLTQACAEKLPFSDHSFDACTIAFGIRNFENPQIALDEIFRILKPGGKLWVLEFSKSTGLFSIFFKLYFKKILPLVGRLISKDTSAYRYLPDSVQNFPSGNDFLSLMQHSQFKNLFFKSLTSGVASIYCGTK